MSVTAALKVFSKCTAHIPRHTPVGLAVSGGSDSLALTVLATKLFDNVRAFIVDHKLRASSREEAESASELVRSLGAHPHTLTLDWTDVGGSPSQGKVQMMAREKRYAALLEQCQSMGLSTLMLGHHRGDQHENFLHRFSMGSGVEGLGGMSPVTTWPGYHDVKLLRPLLTLEKSALVEVCRCEGVEWVEDPTNQSTVYTRNHYRKLLAEDQVLEKGVSQLTDLCHDTRRLLAQQVCSHVTSLAALDNVHGFMVVNLRKLLAASRPVAKRSLAALVRFISGMPDFQFRYGALEKHYQSALNYSGKPISMGKSLIAPVNSDNENVVGIFQALDKFDVPRNKMTIQPGQTVIWQNRWEVKLTGENGEYLIENLNKRNDALAIHGIRRVRSTRLPPERARPGLPVITDASGKVLLIPHYKYIARNTNIRATVTFKPKFTDIQNIVNMNWNYSV